MNYIEASQTTVTVNLRELRQKKHPNDTPLSPFRRLHRYVVDRWLWLLLCAFPSVLGAIYFLLIAASVYVSEVKYVVRTPSESSGAMSNFLQTTSISKATDDAHSINAYLISRDALELLRREANLDEVFDSPKGDFLSRYPGPFSSRNSENQFKFFEKMVSVKFDKTTGISTLSVRAFDAHEAQAVARRLIASGEEIANRLTIRMRGDLVERATQDAAFAREAAYLAQQDVTRWRNREQQVDPTQFSNAIIEVIARMSLELALVRAQLFEMSRSSPSSPSIASLQSRIRALEQQIEREKASLAGSITSLAPKITEYEQLQLERQMTEKLFSSSVTSLETARSEAHKQRIYVERIVEPQLADYPSLPYRWTSLIVILIISQLIYMVVFKIGANISRHGAFARYFQRPKPAAE